MDDRVKNAHSSLNRHSYDMLLFILQRFATEHAIEFLHFYTAGQLFQVQLHKRRNIDFNRQSSGR